MPGLNAHYPEGRPPEEQAFASCSLNAFQQNMLETTGRRLYTPTQLDALTEQNPEGVEWRAMAALLSWIRRFIMQPHPGIGRSGPICPFVKPAMDADVVYFARIEGVDPQDDEGVCRELTVYKDIFRRMTPQTGPLSELRCLMVINPGATGEAMEEIVRPDRPLPLKTEFLRQNVMMGQFHDECPVQALLNPEFFPLRSPVPFFVLRSLIESDVKFLRVNRQWRRIYRARFGKNSLYLKAEKEYGGLARLSRKLQDMPSALLGLLPRA